jgi:2-polyprenyl-6-methoxyphenol hydroxylase-like FAD-dependent oxidoreductase
VTAQRIFDVAILGGGPVGLVGALETSKHSSVVLVADRLPEAMGPPRLEAVPPAFISFLISLGVHPGRIGVDCLYDTRTIAWEQSSPNIIRGPAVAHLERPALERELFELARRSTRLSIVLEAARPSFDGTMWNGRSWRAATLIDATGRRAACAINRVRPSRPWVCRGYFMSSPRTHGDRALRIAALPFGYAYRLGSSRYDTVVLVGRGGNLRGSPGKLQQAIEQNGGSWILEGLPGLADLASTSARPVSVQWANNPAVTAIGDAALARDILSSQGVATGVSEAVYAGAIHRDEDNRLFKARQLEQRQAHLTALGDLIANCRFRHRENWAEYSTFVARHRTSAGPREKVGLVAGQIVAC